MYKKNFTCFFSSHIIFSSISAFSIKSLCAIIVDNKVLSCQGTLIAIKHLKLQTLKPGRSFKFHIGCLKSARISASLSRAAKVS